MHSFEQLSSTFATYFNKRHFPEQPATLYEPNEYFLKIGGKRIRPVLCLMGNEMFDDISNDAWEVATAIELFHNFTLIHDDIMDKAPVRRGFQTLHTKYNESTAILAGDVMFVAAYERINLIDHSILRQIIALFNTTARQVCEGQQIDMDFESREQVTHNEYLNMIALKTSVLLAASLQMGGILGGTGERNQQLLYEFGKKLGLAFQVQDDYLDAFGDPSKFGKQVGGDILANKKTFLLVQVMNEGNTAQKKELSTLKDMHGEEKIARTLELYKDSGADQWTMQLKDKYFNEALAHLDAIAVLNKRKEPLHKLAEFLVQRDY